jgi:hypothetical protein
MVEAIMVNCPPVFFRNTTVRAFSNWIDYNKFSIAVSASKNDVQNLPNFRNAMPIQVINRMKNQLQSIAWMFDWNADGIDTLGTKSVILFELTERLNLMTKKR